MQATTLDVGGFALPALLRSARLQAIRRLEPLTPADVQQAGMPGNHVSKQAYV